MKVCSTCRDPKEESEFSPSNQTKDGWHGQCKPCRRRAYTAYYLRVRVKRLARIAKVRQEFGEKVRSRERAKRREFMARRTPEQALARHSRTRVYQALKGSLKSARTTELLGCSIPELKLHLEILFRPGMTWDNYGPVWHVDHKRPCASFDLSDPTQQRECFHFSNLQPLFKEENLSKAAKLGLTFP